MKKISTLILSFLVVACSVKAQTKYFKGLLEASQEVPANASTALGVVIVKYNTETNEFNLVADYQNLSAAISASHIHNAAAGVNGGVLFNLTNTGGTSGTLTANAVLTEPQETELLAGRFYANAHTSTYPGGEIRAQLSEATLGQTGYYSTSLSGSQEVPPNASTAAGNIVALVDKGTAMFYATGSFSGLGSNASAGHLHTAAAGSNGPVTFPFNIITGSSGGVFSKNGAVTPTQITDFEGGNIYANIHSTGFPGGEIRGQLALMADPQAIYYKGILSSSEEVPTNASAAFGVVLVKYDLGTNAFVLTGDYQNLTSLISGSHVHNAAVGVNGPVIIPLTNTGLTSGGLFVSTVITDAQEAELLAGRFYTNVHSSNNPGGEIRTQLTPTTEGMTMNFNGIFSGSNEVPSNASNGTGAINTLLDKGTGMLYVTGGFTGLGSASTSAHLHKGAAGVNGPVVFPLNFTPGPTSGVLSLSTAVDAQTSADIQNGLFYANVHSSGFPGGEVRAQLSLGPIVVLPVKLVSFTGFKNQKDVMLNWEVNNVKNFKSFTVQQLNTQTNQWVNKGEIDPVENSGTQRYSFNDLPLLLTDVLYYRLKMTDLDGKTTYSAVITINFKTGRASLNLLANPVKGNQLRFQLSGVVNPLNANASIRDISGRLLVKSRNVNAGVNTIDISALSKGMYKLMVTINNELVEVSFLK